MIHYHGTPAGGENATKSEFLSGRHALVSFAHPQDLGVCLDVCQSVVLDNGAFTTWKQGKRFDFDAYGVWIESLVYHPSVDWCLIPDIIDGDERNNRSLAEEWGKAPVRDFSVPVYHMHESFDYLSWLMSNFSTVALGSSGQWATPGSVPWWARMSEIMDYACGPKGVPPVKFHGLRMLNPAIFRQLPLSSADSASASRNSGDYHHYGKYIPPSRSQRANIIANRIEQYQSAPFWENKKKDQLCFMY